MNARRIAPCRPLIHLSAAAIGYTNTPSTAFGENCIEQSVGMDFGIDLQRRMGEVQ